jgi:hypothetical protein
MKRNKQRTNWIIDATLFGGFLLAMWLDLTGLAAHEWLGLAVGVLAGYHLWVRRSWVKAVTGRLFGRTSRQSRLFYAVDAGLAVGFTIILLTGLAISTWLDLSLASGAAWRNVHVLASILTLAILVIKIMLHWRWIAGVARRHIFPTPAPAGTGAALPVSVAVRVDRRDFLRIMGITGAAALLASVNVLSDGVGAQPEETATSQASAGAARLANASPVGSTGACTVRCARRCSYPGHCRRYADANGNGRCDLGECETG